MLLLVGCQHAFHVHSPIHFNLKKSICILNTVKQKKGVLLACVVSKMMFCMFYYIVESLLVQDKSWRVRYMVANQLYELCEAVGPDPTR